MNGEKEECHCGHSKDAHHFDERGPGDCLGMGCNNCHGYRDASLPDPLAKRGPEPRRPQHTSLCLCADCKAYLKWNGGKEWRLKHDPRWGIWP